MDVLVGTVILWPIDWVPRGWALCNGAILPVNQYETLYSLIGNTYGGNGTTTFALPNLGGYIAVGAGTPPGRDIYIQGSRLGAYETPLRLNKLTLATHSHELNGTCTIPSTSFPMSLKVSGNDGERNIPQDNDVLSATTEVSRRPVKLYTDSLNTEASLSGIEATQNQFRLALSGQTDSAGSTDNELSVRNIQRSIVMRYIIAIQGEYPRRS